VSYRTFKHLLGETSLERKCRFIFGSGIFLVVTLSFYWYGLKTESLVIGQKTEAARVLVGPVLAARHMDLDPTSPARDLFLELSDEAATADARAGYRTHFVPAYGPFDDKSRPADAFEAERLDEFLREAAASARVRRLPPDPNRLERPRTFPTGKPIWAARIAPGRREYQYVEAVLYRESCIGCHAHKLRRGPDGKWVETKTNDLAGMVSIRLPMDATSRDIHRNRAILISTALVTAILAMVTSYVIVRYIIVKPVKHLRDVSDAIAAGKLNIRSQIHTGDEFEELSHAFNRMLHNLVAMQQELREVNADLDKKVDELAQANMALFEMNRIKSDFLATMSHELRTPLNSIIGFSEVLASNDQLPERQRRFAQNIFNSGKMLLGMINDILDLAKIESGKMELHVEDFSIRDVCESLVSSMRPLADKKDINLECRLDDALPLLHQDPGKIRQIIYNLLSNAIKFTPEGGRVTLSARGESRHVVIEVADTGIGIPHEDRERIFEKFRQAGMAHAGDGVLTREHEGTGLGLSIVRELARMLGGEVTLESTVGKGSTFTVRLPMQLGPLRPSIVELASKDVDLTKARKIELRPGEHPPVGGPHEPSRTRTSPAVRAAGEAPRVLGGE
jgi:signal transduction histidine kinase